MSGRAHLQPDGSPDWVRDAVFYQIFVDRFASSARVPKPGELEPWDAPPTATGFKGGDLPGIAEHLDDLQSLGVTALYLTPIFASASTHRYHTFDYEAVDPLLGGDAALRSLLDSAHPRGMRVILDGVFNHASRGFWPFHHILENGAASPYRDWFHLDRDVLTGRRGLTAYPGKRKNARLGYGAWWGLPALPQLNHSNPAVREYIYGIAERWLRFGIDGWRLDVPEEIREPGFWEEFRRRCRAVNPEAYLVGEIWNPALEWVAGASAGSGAAAAAPGEGVDAARGAEISASSDSTGAQPGGRFDGLMNYRLAESILSFVGAGRLDQDLVGKTWEYARNVRPIDGPEFGRQLAWVMTVYPPAVTQLQLNLLDSHDTPRFLSLAGGDRTALRLASLIQMTLPGAPCIYYGDEVGVEGRQDPDCRRSYPWDPTRQDGALRAFLSGLIALRKSEPAMRRGRFRLLELEGSPAGSTAGSTASPEGSPAGSTGSAEGSPEGPTAGSIVAYALDFEGSTEDDEEERTEGRGSRGGRGSDAGRPITTGPTDGRPVESRPSGRREPGYSIVVVVNAGELPNRVRLAVPGPADYRVEQVSWSGCEWTSPFAPAMNRDGTLEVGVEARAGVVLRVSPNL